MTKVSFIIPVYNGEAYLAHALSSVAAQTLRDFEALVIDDGSSDRSARIARSFAEKDGRFQVIFRENGGAAAARNEGLKKARGEYILFLDADDALSPTAAEDLTALADNTGADIVFFGRVNEENGKITATVKPPLTGVFRGEPCKTHFARIATAHFVTDKLFRRSLVEASGARFPALSVGEDGVFFARVYRANPTCVAGVDTPYYHYTEERLGSLSNSYHADRMKDNFLLSRTVWETVEAWGLSEQSGYREKLRYVTLRDLLLGIKNAALGKNLSFGEKKAFVKSAMANARVRESVDKLPLSAAGSRNDKLKLWLLKLRAYRLLTLLTVINQQNQRN